MRMQGLLCVVNFASIYHVAEFTCGILQISNRNSLFLCDRCRGELKVKGQEGRHQAELAELEQPVL